VEEVAHEGEVNKGHEGQTYIGHMGQKELAKEEGSS
jgi:hypothetical protein